MSRLMLAFRTLMFTSFTLFALSSPFIAYRYPEIFSSPSFLIGAVVVMGAVILSWPIAGGCPFTVWENRFRIREGKGPYGGPCIDRYTYVWLGLKLPDKLSTKILILLLMLPVLSSLATWL